jgi:hypothetical protein
MSGSCNYRDALLQRRIRTRSLVCSPRYGGTKKTHRERKLEDSVGDRRAGGCAASRELRITCVAFGIRNHPRERIVDRHGAYRPALPAFGAVEEPEDLPHRLPFCRLTDVERPLVSRGSWRGHAPPTTFFLTLTSKPLPLTLISPPLDLDIPTT